MSAFDSTAALTGAMAIADKWQAMCERTVEALRRADVTIAGLIAERDEARAALSGRTVSCVCGRGDGALQSVALGYLARAEAAELEVERLRGLLANGLTLPGWWCVCDLFNGEAVAKLTACRSCGRPKSVRPAVAT